MPGGNGCINYGSGLPEHNPSPSTERGKRRHSKRNDQQRKHTEAAWGRSRSIQKSELQKVLESSNNLTPQHTKR